METVVETMLAAEWHYHLLSGNVHHSPVDMYSSQRHVVDLPLKLSRRWFLLQHSSVALPTTESDRPAAQSEEVGTRSPADQQPPRPAAEFHKRLARLESAVPVVTPTLGGRLREDPVQ